MQFASTPCKIQDAELGSWLCGSGLPVLVRIYPAAFIEPRWIGRTEYPTLNSAEDDKVRTEWEHSDRVFLAVATDAFLGPCHWFARRPMRFIGSQKSLRRHQAYISNSTDLFSERMQAYNDEQPWALAISNAVVSFVYQTYLLRTFCSLLTTRCAEYLGAWGNAWCVFLRKLRVVAFGLTEAGVLVPHLNTSMSRVLRETFPRDMILPMTALANGKMSMSDGFEELYALTISYISYLGHVLREAREILRKELCRVDKTFNAFCCTGHDLEYPFRGNETAAFAGEEHKQSSIGAALTPEPDHTTSQNLPSNGRIVVLLRGASFREGKRNGTPCLARAVENQTRATRSLLDKIVRPLEDLGNIVDIFWTDWPCNLRLEYLEMLGSARLVADLSFRSMTQLDNIRTVLNVFNAFVGGIENVALYYDLVLLTRHDIIWEQSIDSWHANFSMFNFAFPCELCTKFTNVSECVHDILHVMPGNMYHPFDREVGKGRCFVANCTPACEYWQSKSGHACYPQMVDALGEQNVGFASLHSPAIDVREHNDFANIY